MEPDSRPTQGSFQINPEVADTLIKITFSTTEAIKDLLQYIGNQENFDNIQLSTLQPIFFGNRENDISFLLDNKLYYFFAVFCICIYTIRFQNKKYGKYFVLGIFDGKCSVLYHWNNISF